MLPAQGIEKPVETFFNEPISASNQRQSVYVKPLRSHMSSYLITHITSPDAELNKIGEDLDRIRSGLTAMETQPPIEDCFIVQHVNIKKPSASIWKNPNTENFFFKRMQLMEKIDPIDQLSIAKKIYMFIKNDRFQPKAKQKIAQDHGISPDQLNLFHQYLEQLDFKLNEKDHYPYLRAIFTQLNTFSRRPFRRCRFRLNILYNFNIKLLENAGKIRHVTQKTLVKFISENFTKLKEELRLDEEVIDCFKEFELKTFFFDNLFCTES